MSSLLHYFETGFLTEFATHAFSWPISFKDPPVSATPVVRLTTHTGLLHWCWGSSNPYACMAGTLPTKLSLQLLFCFLFYLYMISCVCMDIHMPQHVCGGLRATSDVRPFTLFETQSHLLIQNLLANIWGLSYLCLLSCTGFIQVLEI